MSIAPIDLNSYGPIAFGVVSLLVIWRMIVAPELKAHRGLASSVTTAATAAERACASAEKAAELAKDAAALSAAAAERLEKLIQAQLN